MQNDTTCRLATIPNIVGIKDATGDLQRGAELIAKKPEGFAVYSGDDGTAAELMLNGALGNISVTANVLPAKMAELCRLAIQAAQGGDEQMRERTLTLDNSLQPLHGSLFCESNPIPVKWAMYKMGKINARNPVTAHPA